MREKTEGRRKMTETVELKSALNVKTLVIPLIIIVVGTFFQTLGSGDHFMMDNDASYWTWYPPAPLSGPGWELRAIDGHNLWSAMNGTQHSAFQAAFGWAIFLVIVCAVVNQIRRGSFTRQEVALMTIMIIAALFWYNMASHNADFTTLFTYMAFSYAPEGVFGYIPPDSLPIVERSISPTVFGAFIGQNAFWENYLGTKGNPIPWGIISPSMAYLTVWVFSTALMAICAGLLVRRLYVDIEMLPFPIATIQTGMVELTQTRDESNRVGLFANKFFLIAFAIQFFWLLIPITANFMRFRFSGALSTSNPWDPGADNWAEGVTSWGVYPIFAIGTTAFEMGFLFEPWLFGMASFVSIDVLIGFIVTYIIFGVILPAATVSSWNPDGSLVSFGEPSLGEDTGGYFNYGWVGIGMLAAFAVVPLVRHRSYLVTVLKALIGAEPDREFDPQRPLPYRLVWWLLIASGLISVGLAVGANVNVGGWVALLIILTITGLGVQRMVAESGGMFGSFDDNGAWTASTYMHYITYFLIASLGLQGIMGENVTGSVFMTGLIIGWTTTFWAANLHSGAYHIQAQSVGKRSRLKLRDVFIGVSVAILVSLLASQILTWWLLGTYTVGSGNRIPTYMTETAIIEGDWVMTKAEAFKFPYNLDPAHILPRLIAGFIAVAVIFFARGRWPALRFSVAGAAIFFIGWTSYLYFIPFLLALIVKYITMRIGGPRLFQEKIIPIALGFFCATPLVWIISTTWPALFAGFPLYGWAPYPWFQP